MSATPTVPPTYAQFIVDYPEFSNAVAYPQSAFNNYLNQAALQLNVNAWQGLIYQGTELFIAHHLMLYKRRQDTAQLGAYPGIGKGNISSESPGQVSISYDTQVGAEDGGGFWNQTEYGQEFIRLARLRGMTVMQLNAGCSGAPGQVNSYMAWPGPPTGNGFSF